MLRIDKLIKIVGENVDDLVIVSDHGFASYRYCINVARILYELGLLKISLNKTRCLYNTLRNMLIEVLLNSYQTYNMPKSMLKLIYRIREEMGTHIRLTVGGGNTVSSSIAFVHPCNIRGVVVRNYNVINELIKIFSNMKGVLEVLRREKAYHGPYVKRAPEILLFPSYDLGYTLSNQHAYTDLRLIMKGRFYDHHPEGIFIALSDQIIRRNKNNL